MKYFPITAVFLAILFSLTAKAQTEFPKEFIMHLRLHSGAVFPGAKQPALYVGGLQVVPQYTFVPYKLRGGAVIGGAYTGRKFSGLFGPTLSYKLTEFKGGYFGSLGNVHLTAEHLWGTKDQRLVGGGLNLDLLNKLIVGLSAHRDYHLATWWVGTSVALRISKVAKPKETFPN